MGLLTDELSLPKMADMMKYTSCEIFYYRSGQEFDDVNSAIESAMKCTDYVMCVSAEFWMDLILGALKCDKEPQTQFYMKGTLVSYARVPFKYFEFSLWRKSSSWAEVMLGKFEFKVDDAVFQYVKQFQPKWVY